MFKNAGLMKKLRVKSNYLAEAKHKILNEYTSYYTLKCKQLPD